MRRRTAAVIAIAIGFVLFAYFAPVVYVRPAMPADCVYGCQEIHGPYYGSLTQVLLGNGAVYQSGQYLINPFGSGPGVGIARTQPCIDSC